MNMVSKESTIVNAHPLRLEEKTINYDNYGHVEDVIYLLILPPLIG